jgi:hypothetical protein
MYKGRPEYEAMRDFILKVESFFKKLKKKNKKKKPE